MLCYVYNNETDNKENCWERKHTVYWASCVETSCRSALTLLTYRRNAWTSSRSADGLWSGVCLNGAMTQRLRRDFHTSDARYSDLVCLLVGWFARYELSKSWSPISMKFHTDVQHLCKILPLGSRCQIQQEAQLLLGYRATRKHAKDRWNGRGNDNLGWNDRQMYFKLIKSGNNRKL